MPKNQLQKEGYDFEKVKEPLYFLKQSKRKGEPNEYVRINENIYQDILNGNLPV